MRRKANKKTQKFSSCETAANLPDTREWWWVGGGRKISELFILLSFHVQLPTNIILKRKLLFIAYKSASIFLMRSVSTRSFEHLNKVGIRATMDSKVEAQI